MLGLSLSKILFTILLLIAVWRAWKLVAPFLAKLDASGSAPARPRRPAPAAGPAAGGSSSQARALDLVSCPGCGTFIAAGSRCGCGRTADGGRHGASGSA